MRRIIVGIILAAMGASILWWLTNTYSKIRASSSWPTADGMVVHSTVAVDSTRIRGGSYRIMYRVDVLYRYQVGGRRYESSTFVFGVPRSYADRATAQAEAGRYPIGSHVPVRYDPAEPQSSCLIPGEIPETFQLSVWLSAAFALAGLMLIISGALSARNNKPKLFEA